MTKTDSNRHLRLADTRDSATSTEADDYTPPAPAPSSISGSGLVDYCPWRHLGQLEGVTLTWHDGGHTGLTTFSTKTISLRRGMSESKRRSVLAHEIAHVDRGPVRCSGKGSLGEQINEALTDELAVVRMFSAWTLENLPRLVEAHGVDVVADVVGVTSSRVRMALALIAVVTA